MRRYQKEAIVRDLRKKMVLLAGPRQAGKTTLAKEIAEEFESHVYLNYDSVHDRKVIKAHGWRPSAELVILDEIHKMPKWKNFLKGCYDTKPEKQKILGVGSGRPEMMWDAGDSLAGRYFLHHLLPLSPAECSKVQESYTLGHFLERGGFPEPFMAKEKVEADRWREQYIGGLLRADVLELIFELLRERVGSPVSYASLARDAEIAPNTVKKYIQILEALYIVFRVTPFSHNIARSLLKEPKIYFFDGGLVRGNEGIKFENLVATCLYKEALARRDYLAQDTGVRYIRTKEGIEVDFVMTLDGQIEKMIEVKWADRTVSRGLKYFYEKYGHPATQVVGDLRQEWMEEGIEIVRGESFLKGLFL